MFKFNMKIVFMVILSLSLSFAAGSAKNVQKQIVETSRKDADRLAFIPNKLIIKLVDYKTSSKAAPQKEIESFGIYQLDVLMEKLNVRKIERSFPEKALSKSAAEQELARFFYLKLDNAADLEKALYELNNNDYVQYVEKIPIHYTNVVPNDPLYMGEYYVLQSHLKQISAEAAWDINTGGSDVVLAIIDTGVDWEHEDLQTKIWVNSDETLDGEDTDGNGYVDDIRGWDFVHVATAWTSADMSEDGEDADNDPMDVDGHGTHCSGIAGAATDNEIGIAGTNWGVTIMPVRVGYLTEDDNGSIPFGYEGVVYAADNGADILSLSWGGGSYHQAAQDIMDYAWNKGCVIIAAAGNDDSPEVHYPSGYNHVVAVGATGNVSDKKADYSNYGF
ncbi:MAG: S8 family serine peptidase, partial [Candidatus Marinimicrobia bacterium]|nr:S8 family serine peptidase [Candidatus Neomarinimicrobiota bacterium]